MHFNFALLPQDENLVRTCISVAQKNFHLNYSEYLLGDKALPHITLCQFESEEEKLPAIWSELISGLNAEIDKLSVVTLKFQNIYIKPGVKMHKGNFWIGLAVEPNASLSAAQELTSKKLAQLGIQCSTSVSEYSPHLTLARCSGGNPISLIEFPPVEFWAQDFAFSPSIGLSDAVGVYHKRLWPI